MQLVVKVHIAGCPDWMTLHPLHLGQSTMKSTIHVISPICPASPSYVSLVCPATPQLYITHLPCQAFAAITHMPCHAPATFHPSAMPGSSSTSYICLLGPGYISPICHVRLQLHITHLPYPTPATHPPSALPSPSYTSIICPTLPQLHIICLPLRGCN